MVEKEKGTSMNNTQIIMFDGICLEATDQTAMVFPYDKYTYKTFPDNYCGAGNGLGERLVPDYIFGSTRVFAWCGLDISIKISMACFLHDKEFEYAGPSVTEFVQSNDLLHKNIESIIKVKARNDYVLARAMYRPVTYMNAVSILGRYVFWSLKAAQGYKIPNMADRYVTNDFVERASIRIRAGALSAGRGI